MPIPFHLGEMSVGEMSVHCTVGGMSVHCTVGEKSVGERSVGDLSPHRIIDIYNSQFLLKLPILDKFRLVTFHSKSQHNIKTGLHQFRRNESSHDLDS
jgi:hypothetical protein